MKPAGSSFNLHVTDVDVDVDDDKHNTINV
jgi:hypothetical protein